MHLVQGNGTIKTGTFEKQIGERLTPFDRKTATVYLPPGTPYTVTGTGLEAVVVKAPVTAGGQLTTVEPADVTPLEVGKDNRARTVTLVAPPASFPEALVAGVTFNPSGNWSGVPAHYRRMYSTVGNREQVVSTYMDKDDFPPDLLDRTRANYSGAVTMCDRWFGFLMETLRVLGRLDDTAIILTSDHGHSIGEGNYMGKRGYPSAPEVYKIPLLIRFPKARHGGHSSDMFVQHHDISAAILELAGVQPPTEIDGIPFVEDALSGRPGARQSITVGWGSTPTVITDRWWSNAKMDGSSALLYDLDAKEPFSQNVADLYPDVVDKLFAQARKDAGGAFPAWLVELAQSQADAPGCSDMAARA